MVAGSRTLDAAALARQSDAVAAWASGYPERAATAARAAELAGRGPTDAAELAEVAEALATLVAVATDVTSGMGPAPERAVLASAARALTRRIAARHPGRIVELRVPPYAAVQLGLGPAGAHRRGTPPNVVELDVLTLLRLTSGAESWVDAAASGRVRASGLRSDLAEIFPLPGNRDQV